MYCITRNDMKFGEYLIPARTKCRVIYISDTTTVNAPGVQVKIAVNFFEIKKREVDNENIITDRHGNTYGSHAKLDGITIYTNTKAVYMDADAERYSHTSLYKWQAEKIFPDGIPDYVTKEKYGRPTYPLEAITEYLEEHFADWVQNNCEFRRLTKDDIENGPCFDGAEPGDRTLSEKGLEQFYEKQLEYQNRLETTGFTYDFKGGLIWD